MKNHAHHGGPPRRHQPDDAPELFEGPRRRGGHPGGHRGAPHRSRPHGRGGRRSRMGRGDVRTAILLLLSEEPMHGYQLMTAITERSGGRWTPSPGAVYPAINQLEDEGLVTVTADSGRRVVTLTGAGRAALDAEAGTRRDPFDDQGGTDRPDLRALVGQLQDAARQVGRAGSAEQVAQAAALLTETRRKLYLILAEAPGTEGS